MLTELRLTNFKAFGETQRIPIKPLTLIFGANSSGKSSIIHSLLLANHAQASGNFDVHRPQLAGGTVDLGGFRTYVHSHELANMVTQYFEAEINRELLSAKMVGATDEEKTEFLKFCHYGLALSWGSPAGVLHQIEFSLNRRPVLRFRHKAGDRFSATVLSEFGTLLAGEINRMLKDQADDVIDLSLFLQSLDAVVGEDDFLLEGMVLIDPRPEFVRRWPSGMGQIEEQVQGGLQAFFTDWDWDNSEELPYWAEAQTLRFNLSSLIRHCSGEVAELLKGLRYLGPIRRTPDRYFMDAPPLGGTGAADMSAWAKVLADESLRGNVNSLLEKFELPYSMKPNHLSDDDKRERGVFPEFEDSAAQKKFSHLDIGFGISQMLPVLVEAVANENMLIAVEQPESQLHPAHQAQIGDVFIASALGQRKNTFLLETHSEHLILRILRRIRETTEGTATGLPPVRPEDVSVLYVQPGPSGAEVVELPVTPDGDFDRPWPGGFFAERFQELP